MTQSMLIYDAKKQKIVTKIDEMDY